MKCSALEINYKDGMRQTATAERDEKVHRLYDRGMKKTKPNPTTIVALEDTTNSMLCFPS